MIQKGNEFVVTSSSSSTLTLDEIEQLARSHLTEHWHGTDTVMLAESVLVMLSVVRVAKMWQEIYGSDDVDSVRNAAEELWEAIDTMHIQHGVA